ncbi:MAG: glutamate formimidoyltransferase [Dysgonamonadaceae bacterium]|jgi:glutamate formiminotransferase/formiminotetrahydrofolate cyclodeaminase|nr:glutamate formimidoyltransferase [Dysgonamonadaceae bacterium]
MKQLIECVPNFSEGRDRTIINRIVDEIKSVDGVQVIDIDPGKATNRTVVTFVGDPESVCEAAFRAVKKAAELIDMSRHKGEHPRFGATDVLPLIPVNGITMEETVEYARKLGQRIGNELGIPVYCYEFAASEEKRRNLANCRAGEYEGLPQKLVNPGWKPDFGPAEFTETVRRSGATALGARNFLIAYNVNLNTTSTRWANSIAFDIREKGRVKREGNPLTGKMVRDENGELVYTPGLLKGVKGIGWYIEEYGIAQLSFNITDIAEAPMHRVFELACERAAVRGIRVTGSELVGVAPLHALLDAGKYFLRKQRRSTGISDEEILKIAVKSLGLDELAPFDPKKKIIEYLIEDKAVKKLVDVSVKDFTLETASESPAPGGGSVAACMGAMGAALGTMVANLSAHKKGWDERWEEFSLWAEKGKAYHDELLRLIDDDTQAFNAIMDAFGLPQRNDEEKAARKQAIQQATKRAMEIPFRVMEASYASMEVMLAMAESGNPHSVSDAGVGALAARSAVFGAGLNVRINASSLNDKDFVNEMLAGVDELEQKAADLEDKILKIVRKAIDK